MALELAVWRIDRDLRRVAQTPLSLDSRLEDLLDQDISIASPDWLVIGRQVLTPYGGRIDLLAIDREGSLVVVELKRDSLPRDIITQVLDYGSWVATLRADEIAPIFDEYRKRKYPNQPSLSIDEAFCQRFQAKNMPEELNERHQLVIVGSVFDPDPERIVSYLADEYGVSINAVFFRVFKDEDREYLTRAWLREPESGDTTVPGGVRVARTHNVNPKTEWNGEYYVSFGEDDRRVWEDARKYGFISAGGGPQYSNRLGQLQPGDRIWVNVPGLGYVGVGIVQGPKTKVDQFQVESDGTRVPILEANLKCQNMGEEQNDPENAEYLVPVKWIKAVPVERAIREKGFFGNQNIVARPRDAKWT